ncbi:Cdc6/Cdc18 family protein [Halococcus sediminicola]|uniref:Cdc6/Cdc18 family protein n=1 Tax=Halococcus sediminicola TaxID=1264579 RepID=UPI0006798167|nr:AAA family ATPase [Halococcus sediminicola]
MGKYDDLFEETAPDDSVFADKGVLDPLADPDAVIGREEQEHTLATLLNGVNEGYLPTTVSVYGPPGTGKTLTTRRVCTEFAARTEMVAAEYVNLKECRTLFSVANEIHLELTGEKKQAYEGLDGVFEGIWAALEDYPEWTVLILDEIDHIKHDSNYDPNNFFYRLLRGEGKLERNIRLSVWPCSNELLNVDLRLDSRVRSAMGGEEVFFPPYSYHDLMRILPPRIETAFRDGALTDAVLTEGSRLAANRWGDARKALTLFRQAGETADERGATRVTESDLKTSLNTTERDAVLEKLVLLPQNHFLVLVAITGTKRGDEIVQPIEMTQIEAFLQNEQVPDELQFGARAIRELVTDLDTMGLVETWIESRGRGGRVKQIETAFDPKWVRAASSQYTASTAGEVNEDA